MDAASRSLERERQAAVDAERAVAGGRRRRHAEPAVVVDAARAEREPGELAELVGLLVREAAAAEDADRVRAVRRRGCRAGASATRSSASSQLASWSAPSAPRTSGAVEAVGCARAAPPRSSPSCTARRGSSGSRGRRPSRAGSRHPPASAGVRVIAHCRAQYGQWVRWRRRWHPVLDSDLGGRRNPSPRAHVDDAGERRAARRTRRRSRGTRRRSCRWPGTTG